ncbi:MAG: RluA family pseudouridine synthase [Sandaracinaceae bacterium]|nr:RluA family pseudouridine synthase [Sandaracinaceae bacterium]
MQRPLREPPPGCPPDSIVLEFPVPRELAGLRLDRFIQTRIPRLSRTRANAIVRACAVQPDGRRRRPSERVRFGEVVILCRPSFEEPVVPTDFGVVHEDDALLVVDKPPGLPVHPSASYHKNTLTWLLRERYPDSPPHLAHRLDRETSGVLVCAKTIEDERAVKAQFERREARKTYLAIVRGAMPESEGVIDRPMGRPDEGLHLLMEVREDGSPARTRYRVVARAPSHTLVALYPLTGRQHQLRVHLAWLGHPIVADKLYGPEGTAPFLEYVEAGEVTADLRARLGHVRQALHAHRLVLRHPREEVELTLVAPLAPDLVELWESLEGEPIGGGVPS